MAPGSGLLYAVRPGHRYGGVAVHDNAELHPAVASDKRLRGSNV